MLRSMTGFASGTGGRDRHDWAWELRGVNARGLDLRLRVPDWIEGLEPALRARLGQVLSRGSVSVTLRIQAAGGATAAALDGDMLDSVLAALAEVETRAMDRGLSLAPATATDVLTVRGVFESGRETEDGTALTAALLADFEPVLEAFDAMRIAEGQALAEVLTGQIDRIAELTEEAARLARERRPEIEAGFRAALARVTELAGGVDEARVAQELATLAVKLDVTEEIDRLRAHVAAARALIAQGSPVGRKLDFLTQEFNREANTLCSKAQNAALGAAGLELKTVIDQMREQVQNVE